jgi:hypothetical protein
MAEWPDTVITDEDLAAWIREHPEVWPYATIDDVDVDVDVDVDRVVDDVMSGAMWQRRRPRWWRRRAFVAGVTVGVLAVGGTAAALVLRSEQPSAPEAGVVCRAEAALDADAIVIPVGDDPVERCEEVWREGRLGVDRSGDVPGLVACIDPRGPINVLPGAASVCADLGLEAAAADLDAAALSVVELQDRLVEEINLADCQPAEAVERQVLGILAEMGFDDWQVVVVAEPDKTVCAKVGVDSAANTINIIEV